MASVKGFKECRDKFNEIVVKHIENELIHVCDMLVSDAKKSRGFMSFTGNTATSYSCGLYIKGELVYVAEAGDGMRKPIRRKVRKNELARLKKPYEGGERLVRGRVEVDGMYGQDSSMVFLSRYKAPQKGFCIVMTTGTEYSEYIEQVFNANVLTDTFNRSRKILFDNIKPID